MTRPNWPAMAEKLKTLTAQWVGKGKNVKFQTKCRIVEAIQLTEDWFDGPHPNPKYFPDARVVTYPRTKTVTIKDAWETSAGIGDWLVKDGKRIESYDSYAFAEKFEIANPTMPDTAIYEVTCPFCGSPDIQTYEHFIIGKKTPAFRNRCNECGADAAKALWKIRSTPNYALEEAACMARTGMYDAKELARRIRLLKTNNVDANVMDKNTSHHPQKCPVTGRDFFLVLDHPTLGNVATYGGPYDSYTIPEWNGEEFRSERFDHDAGEWIEGGEPYPFILVDESEFLKIQEVRNDHH